jgi:hypothetical protein
VVAVLARRIDATGPHEDGLMEGATSVPQDPFDRRQKRLLLIAWGATLLPLVVFGFFTWASWNLREELASARSQLEELKQKNAVETKTLAELNSKKQKLESDIARLDADLKAQRESTKHYRDVADIRIQFYRESDREVVEKALVKLGFKVETKLGQSKLIDRKPNSIAYGKLVYPKDLRDIAVALVEAGFPLKRIDPAQRQPDAHLIQIYASAESDRSCGLLSVNEIRAGTTCGAIKR